MRELVYLSDRKLDQFLPDLRSFWPRPKINLKVPLVEIGLEPAADTKKFQLKHLTRVVAQIEASARWFAEPDVPPGAWVHFEAPLNYLVLDHSQFAHMVLFADRRTPTKRYPTGGKVRLLLHGSAGHLVAEGQPMAVTAPTGETVELAADRFGSGPGNFTVDNITLLLNVLRLEPKPSTGRHRGPSEASARHLPDATARLLQAIDERVHVEMAAWMAGFARVTASFVAPAGDGGPAVRYVIASPLYVEYTTPPAIG